MPVPDSELASGFCTFKLAVFVRMSRGILKLEMRTLAATRRREVFALDACHLERVFAIVMHDRVDAGDPDDFARLVRVIACILSLSLSFVL